MYGKEQGGTFRFSDDVDDFSDGKGLALPLLSGRVPVVGILEAAGDNAAVVDFSGQQLRTAAMGAILGFVDVGDFTFDAMNSAIFVLADMDGDEELSEDEEEYISELYQEVANGLMTLGVSPEDVQSFLDDESDEAAATVGAALAAKLEATTSDDETIIANYAVAGDMVLESVVKVIRGGKVILKKKRIGRPKKMTSLQRASLKKARTKAFTGAARIARKKSMRIRKSRGM